MLTALNLPPKSSVPNPSLPPPFDQLVADGTLTHNQAQLVLQAIQPGDTTTTLHADRRGLVGRLAEVGAYLGAALVVAAGIVVVAQQWVDMGYGLRLTVMVGTTFVLLAAAVALVLFAGGGRWDRAGSGPGLRRLDGALFSLAALAAWGTILTALLSDQELVTEREASIAFIAAGCAAFAVLVPARIWADTPLSEFGMVAASVSIVAGLIQLLFADRAVAIQWTLLGLGIAWALVGTYTQWMRCRTLVTALGLVIALFGAATIAENDWSHRLALATLVVFTLTVYLMRPTWPYIAVATVAAVVLTVVWVGEALGAALALLAAGVVVLVLAGGALLLHVRRSSGADAGTETL
jgi:hypothetical protein